MSALKMCDEDFIDEIYEIAFGAGATEAEPSYPREEVLNKIREFSNTSIEQTTNN
jgi:hypothetical protein